MSTDASESSRAESSGGQLWNSIAGLLCCCTSSVTRAPGSDIEAKETKSNGEKKEKTPKKNSKGTNSSSSDDDDTNLLKSEETLFGKQWFGYSRKVSKKGKPLKKNTNLDDLGSESKPIDTNIMKAKLDVRQRQKRAPSAQHIKRMMSNDVFDNNVPQEHAKEPDAKPSSFEPSCTIPEENPVDAKTEENPEKVESSKPPEQNEDTGLASKENGESTEEGKSDDVVAKQENPAAAKEESEEVATSASGETAKTESTAAEPSGPKKPIETKEDVTKNDVTEAVASDDVTTTPDDAVKDAVAASPADVKAGSNDLESQPLVKDTENVSSSAAVLTANAPVVEKDETTDSRLIPPTIESPAESSSPKTKRDGEPVLANREDSCALPSDAHLQPNEKNTKHIEEEEKKKNEEEEEEEEVLKAEASKNKEQASTEEAKDERTENKKSDGSKPEAEPSETRDEQEKQEKTEADKEISSSESHLPTEAMIKAQET